MYMYMYYSGESGAGKTESTKFVVKQIIELCNGNTQLEQQILQVSNFLSRVPLLRDGSW